MQLSPLRQLHSAFGTTTLAFLFDWQSMYKLALTSTNKTKTARCVEVHNICKTVNENCNTVGQVLIVRI